jgi:hypothetical protein
MFSGIVDYAGLFPPAKLDMDAAVSNYQRYREGKDAWMLGCFVVPLGRFDEFLAAVRDHVSSTDEPWRVSVVIGDDVAADLDQAAALDLGGHGEARIEGVEVKATSPDQVAMLADAVPAGMNAFVEIDPGEGLEELVKAIAPLRSARFRAKIRTGGVTREVIPPVEHVGRFLRLCYASDLAFKATAGLHHAVRGEHALTYDEDAPFAVMHGFLNVFLAAAFCFNGLGGADAVRLLSLESPGEWSFDDDCVRWEEYRLSTDEIVKIRRRFAISFGSCSFEEPLQDLRRLGLID